MRALSGDNGACRHLVLVVHGHREPDTGYVTVSLGGTDPEANRLGLADLIAEVGSDADALDRDCVFNVCEANGSPFAYLPSLTELLLISGRAKHILASGFRLPIIETIALSARYFDARRRQAASDAYREALRQQLEALPDRDGPLSAAAKRKLAPLFASSRLMVRCTIPVTEADGLQ